MTPQPPLSAPAALDPLEAALADGPPEPADAVRRPDLTADPAVDVAYAVADTALGRMLLARRADGRLVATSFVADDARADAVLDRVAARVSPRVVRAPRRLDDVRRALDEYAAGRRRDLAVPVDWSLTSPFQADVLRRLAATTPYGRTTTYGALAVALGRPSASRAVGAALGANPLCVVLPCHRVVGASGALTGYAGGVEAKRRLLDLEASTFL